MRDDGRPNVAKSAPKACGAISATNTLTKLKPYPLYKESGVEWLGRIPKHWEARPIKRICTLSYGDALAYIERAEGNIDVCGSNRPIGTHHRANTEAPCLAIGRKGSFGKVKHSAKPVFAIDTTFVVDNRYTSTDIRWLYYVLQQADLDSVSKDSAVPGLDREDVYSRKAPFCLHAEQRAIAAFLDRQTARIDALVANKERMIELLQEKRSALITRAVIRGLDPDVPMKDSGTEWLGQIPAHWEANRLKYAAKLNPKPSAVRDLSPSLEVSFVPMKAVGEYGGLDLTSVKPLVEVNSGYTYFGERDVVVAKITPCFENGKGALAEGLVNGVGFGTTELHVLRAVKTVNPKFLFYVSMSDAFRGLGEAEMYGAGGQKRVPESFIDNLKHPLPPLGEQRTIAALLDNETAKIDSLVAAIHKAIDRFKELRTALISAAVTGKIDVREETTPNPGTTA